MSYRLFENPTRKAKKDHRCIWCGEPIAIGSTYIDERSVYDGRIQRHRWHPECQNACHDEQLESSEDEFEPYDNPRPKAP